MTTERTARLSRLDRVAIGAIAVALGFAFLTPPEVTQGNVARLFYVHVPTVLVAYLAYTLTLVASVAYLMTKRLFWDHLAVAGAEVGVVFTATTIGLGMLWAKPTWGVYWTWSARLTLTAIMLFIYIGYLTLRRAGGDPAATATRASIYGIVSAFQIPIVHFSVLWWRDVHQLATVFRPDEMQIDTILFVAFLAGLIAYAVAGAALVRRRFLLAQLEQAVYDAVGKASTPVAGAGVAPPALERAAHGAVRP